MSGKKSKKKNRKHDANDAAQAVLDSVYWRDYRPGYDETQKPEARFVILPTMEIALVEELLAGGEGFTWTTLQDAMVQAIALGERKAYQKMAKAEAEMAKARELAMVENPNGASPILLGTIRQGRKR